MDVGEPSNTGKVDCIEIWVDLPLYRGLGNDNNCDRVDRFICKGDTGNYGLFFCIFKGTGNLVNPVILEKKTVLRYG